MGAMLRCIEARDWGCLPREMAAFSGAATALPSGPEGHYEDLFVGLARAFRGKPEPHTARHEYTDARLRHLWREGTLPADPALKLLAFCHYMSCD